MAVGKLNNDLMTMALNGISGELKSLFPEFIWSTQYPTDTAYWLSIIHDVATMFVTPQLDLFRITVDISIYGKRNAGAFIRNDKRNRNIVVTIPDALGPNTFVYKHTHPLAQAITFGGYKIYYSDPDMMQNFISVLSDFRELLKDGE